MRSKDFVIYGEELFVTIEVKNSLRIRPEDTRGLREFGKDYPMAQCFLIYRGAEKLVSKGIPCLPAEQFLRELRPGRPGF